MNLSAAGPSLGVKVQEVNPDEVYQVMVAASSQDPDLVKQSTARFKQMLDMFGTFDALHEIAAQKQLPLNVRKQSIIQFKNAAPGHWRSRKLLSDDHRNRIRARCFLFLDEEDETITRCNEEVVAKLARHDYPTKWPNLLPELVGLIDANLKLRYTNPLNEDPRTMTVIQRALRLLHSILKELVSIKMPHVIKTLGEITAQYSVTLYGYYTHIASFFSSPDISIYSNSQTSNNLLLGHLTLKSIFKIANWLWTRMERSGQDILKEHQAWFLQVFSNATTQVKNLIELRINVVRQTGAVSPVTTRSIDVLTRHIRLYGKFFRSLQRFTSAKFVQLPEADELVLYYWSQVVRATNDSPEMIGESAGSLYPMKFLVQGMVLFKDSLSQWAPMKKGTNTPNPKALSRDFVENAVQLLMMRFMPLKPSDLQSWMTDPEEWVNLEDQDNDQWEFQLRPCSERVLMTIANQHREYVVPLLVEIFKRVAAQTAVGLSSVIEKEALYCALGRCAIRIKDDIPFDAWLEHTLSSEARSADPLYPIIKRRIAWMLGKWVGESCCSPNNPKIWDVLVYLLQDRGQGSDGVVRLTAAMAVKDCADTIDFDIQVFEPYLATTVAELVKLLAETDTWEAKRRITASLDTIIERSGSRIIPFVALITASIPQLWIDADTNWMLKSSVLATVKTLVNAIGIESSSLGNIIIPLIKDGLSPGSAIHLDQPSTELWMAALRNTGTIHPVGGAPSLAELVPLLINLVATNLDLLGNITNIWESYIFIDANFLVQCHGFDLLSALKSVLGAKGNKAPEINQRDLVRCLHLLVQITPSPLWGEFMHTTGLFSCLLDILIQNEDGIPYMLENISLLSRIALVDSKMFVQLMDATPVTSPKAAPTYLWDALLEGWVGKFDNMGVPRSRKLTAMALGSLASTGRDEVLRKLPTDIFNLWLDVLYEIKEVDDDARQLDDEPLPDSYLKRHWENDDAPREFYGDTEGTPEYERRKMVWTQDPVRTQKFSTFITARLQEAEAVVGSAIFRAECMEKADPTLVKQLLEQLGRA